MLILMNLVLNYYSHLVAANPNRVGKSTTSNK